MSPADSGQPETRAALSHLRPHLGVGDVLIHLWRAKWLMALIFLPLFALGLGAAMMLPERYTATARLLVSPSAERMAYSPESQAQAERELMRSPIVLQAALEKVTLARAFPRLAAQCQGEDCARAGAAALEASLTVEIMPGGQAMTQRLTHGDAVIAAELLNALTRAYLDYRPAILGEEPALGFGAQRERFEREVADAEASIGAYLSQNGLTGLEAEQDTLRRLYEAANLELIAAGSRKVQHEAELASYRRQLAGLRGGVSSAGAAPRQRLQELYVEREELRARLAPNAPALRDVDSRIERLEGLLSAQTEAGAPAGDGLDPVQRDLMSTIARLEADVQAASRQQAELHAQIASLEARDQRMRELTPGLTELRRRRDVAADAARLYGMRAADARARSDLAREGAGDVLLLEPASMPLRGHSLRIPAAFAAFVLAGLAALVTGLLHALSQRGFVTARSLERTIGIPVLATIRLR